MAVSNMGSCYLNGEGVKKDPRRAMDWCEPFIACSALASHELRSSLSHPIPAVRRCRYERAANEGFAPSQCYLGVMYESGACREVGKNDQLAAEWFEKAAQQNFKYACYNVAVCYEQGTSHPYTSPPLPSRTTARPIYRLSTTNSPDVGPLVLALSPRRQVRVWRRMKRKLRNTTRRLHCRGQARV
jgi:TPR repeat protein